MNHQQAVVLCRYVAAVCPQQAIDEFTPDAWADLLEHTQFDDAREAVRALGRRQPFIAPAEIIAETKRIRAERIRVHTDPVPPPDLTPRQSAAWLLNARRRIGDGQTLPDDQRGALTERDTAQLLATAAPQRAGTA